MFILTVQGKGKRVYRGSSGTRPLVLPRHAESNMHQVSHVDLLWDNGKTPITHISGDLYNFVDQLLVCCIPGCSGINEHLIFRERKEKMDDLYTSPQCHAQKVLDRITVGLDTQEESEC
jgi:hypothetical protein